MEYQKINLSTWDRGELFAFYIVLGTGGAR